MKSIIKKLTMSKEERKEMKEILHLFQSSEKVMTYYTGSEKIRDLIYDLGCGVSAGCGNYMLISFHC